jgi:hypothetical protein
VPVTGLDRSDAYNGVVRDHSTRHRTGVLVRARREDFYELSALKDKIDALLRDLQTRPEVVDFSCDLGFMHEEGEKEDLDLLRRVLPQVPHLMQWRSLWLSGGSFPEFLTEVDQDSTGYLPRVEWTVWMELQRLLKSPRMPSFSDYGVIHPIVDTDIMGNMSANIRYAMSEHWMVIKGHPVRRTPNGEPKEAKKITDYAQYRELCTQLVSSPQYLGRTYSRGDQYFDDVANGDATTGNASRWRKADTSHHMTYVVDQILKMPHRS